MKRIILLLLQLSILLPIYGQSYKMEKRIYIVDVTASMEGKGNVITPNIFSEVKQKLANTIEGISDSTTEIVIIPFTNTPHDAIKGETSRADSLIKEIYDINIKKGDTNIADAWKQGLQELDSHKVNYLFLLTDGLHNCGPSREELYDQLKSWEAISANNYYFAFYVMLTPNAKELEIAQIVNQTRQMWLIESMDVNVSFIQSSLAISANVNQNNKVRIYFDSNKKAIFDENVDFNIELEDNPYYEIYDSRIYWKEGVAEFDIIELKPRMEMPVEYNSKLYIKYDKEKYPLLFFTPEIIDFKILNKGVRTMKIREL